MYKEYFGLEELPFSIAPDPRYLYMSEQHREALAHLVYGLNSDGGFVLLTGEVGTGKTTVCRCLLEQLPENSDVAFILNPKLTVEELLATICDELGIAYPPGNSSVKVFVDRINSYLLDAHARGRKTVLIIEEAQNLNADVLEQLRLLTNLETNQLKLLQITMLGQPELGEKLQRPELRQLSQRITARFHLGSLSKKDVAAYVNHRLAVAGVHSELFESSAINELYRRSLGIPRLINVICDRALLGAYVQGQTKVNKSTLSKAAGEVFGERPAAKRILKWVLTGLILIISVTALAATFYNRRIQLFSEKRIQLVETPATLPESHGLEGLDWPAGQPIELSKETAYEALFKEWNIPYEAEGHDTMCKQARGWGLDCMEGRGNLSSALQLNKPCVVKLSDNSGRKFYVALTAVHGQTATLVMGGKIKNVSVDDLSRSWPDAYTVLWRTPRKSLSPPARSGSRGPEVQLLERQMALVQGNTAQSRKNNKLFDDLLAKQVRRFQLSEGLKADGIAGAQTLVHLDTALSRHEPVLALKEMGK